MKLFHKYTACFAAIIIFGMGWIGSASAQSQSAFEPQVELRSAGVSIGGYSPSFDYFDRTIWDFNGGPVLGIETELSIMPVLGVKLGIGYFRTSSSINRPEIEGEETRTYTLMPVSLAPVARYNFPQFIISISPGIDIYRVVSSYEVEAGTESTSGNVTGFNITGGIERSFGAVGIEVYGKYVIGTFEQHMQINLDDPIVREEVDFNGPAAGVVLKYLF